MKAVGVDYWDSLIEQYEILSHEEHVELARIRDEGTTLDEEGKKIFNKSARDAVDKLCLHNLRAVGKRVCSMRCSDSTAIADLMTEGYLGLKKIAERWEPIGPVGFAYVASCYIKDPIFRHAKKFWAESVSLDAQNKEGDDLYNVDLDDELGSESQNEVTLDLALMECLTPAQKIVITSRLLSQEEETDEELAARAGITPARVPHAFRRGLFRLLDAAA